MPLKLGEHMIRCGAIVSYGLDSEAEPSAIRPAWSAALESTSETRSARSYPLSAASLRDRTACRGLICEQAGSPSRAPEGAGILDT